MNKRKFTFQFQFLEFSGHSNFGLNDKMQLDEGLEGIDESNVTRSGDEKNTHDISLEDRFENNGLSRNAYNKLANDIKNGDLNVTMLIGCNENTLGRIADGYNLTWLQKKHS